MKKLTLGIIILGLSTLLIACKQTPVENTEPYEVSILQDFAKKSGLERPQIASHSFEWQEWEKILTIEWRGLSLSWLQESPDDTVESFFQQWVKNEENTQGRGSVNLMGFEKNGIICLSESHIQASLEQINDDAHFPENIPHTLHLSCWQKWATQTTADKNDQKSENPTTLCLSEIEKQIFASPQFSGVKSAYDKALNTPNNEEWEPLLGYYLDLEQIDDKGYWVALAEEYPNRVLKYHRFQVNKKTGEIKEYDVVNDTYDEVIPSDENYSNFFAQNCKNLTDEN